MKIISKGRYKSGVFFLISTRMSKSTIYSVMKSTVNIFFAQFDNQAIGGSGTTRYKTNLSRLLLL